MKNKVTMALVQSLKEQKYVFSQNLNAESFTQLSDLLTKNQGTAFGIAKFALEWALDEEFDTSVSYKKVDKKAFESDLKRVNDLREGLITSYAYQAGALSVTTIMCADDMSDSEMKDLFARFDDVMVGSMRNHAGKNFNGDKLGTYGTVFFIFSDSSKAQKFNDNLLKTFFGSHFWKNTYTSVVTIDCQSKTVTQGKGAMGAKWTGGLYISKIKNKISEVI